MSDSGTPSAARRPVSAIAMGLVVVLMITTLAWALAGSSASITAVRAVADVAAAIALGLSVVPRLDATRYQGELRRRTVQPLAIAAGVWLLAELLRLLLAAAQAAAQGLSRISVSTLLEFTWSTAPGRAALFSLLAAAAVLALALLPQLPVTDVTITGIVATGIAARSVTGHVSESLVGSMAVVAHALAATLWFGTLAALALTVTTRGQWARVLPAFSKLALPAVAVLLVGGTVAALSALAHPAELVSTGHGRLLLAKIVITLFLLVLAMANRSGWLRAARAHRVSAEASLRRSSAELGLLTAALTLAAALTVTG